MAECKWYKDGFCVNDGCPLVADYCPVPDTPDVCKHEDRTPPLNDIKCIDCEFLELVLPYGVCSKGYKGMVSPDDSCGKGKRNTQ